MGLCADAFAARLIQMKSNVAARDNDYQVPLHWMAGNGMRSLATALTMDESNPSAVDSAGHSPLHFATLGGHVATDGRLLQLAGPQAIDGPCAPVVAHQRDAP